MCSFSCVWPFATSWMVTHQTPLSMGFSRQENWSGLPFPPPEDLPDPGIEPTTLVSPALAGGFFTTEPAQFSSVQFSRSVVSDSLSPHKSQHTRPPCPQLPELTQTHVHRVGDAISSSVVPFSSCPQFLPESGSFPMSQFFTWGGQSIGVSALASVLPMNTQDCLP